MRAFGYVRLSRLDSDTTSPQRQREVVAELCRQRGWELLDVFEDLDVSGGKEARRGLDAMLGRLADVDAIVTWKLDRLARSLPHLLKLADRFEAAGVQLVTADGAVDTTTAAGRAFYAMRGTFAQFERDTVSERTKAMHTYLKAQGRVQSRTPFGFQVDGDRRLERDPETWPILVRMMEQIAAGESLRKLGAEYDLPHTTIRVYVRNRRALVELERDRPELAATLRARFQDESFRPGPRSLLAGLAACGVCWAWLRQGKRDGQRVYSCKESGHVHVNAEWLDEQVVHDVLRFVPKLLARKRAETEAEPREDRAAIERMLAELEDDRDAGLVSRERFTTRRARLLERLGRAGSESPRPRLETVDWSSLTPAERRLALREVLEYVEVRPIPSGQSRQGRHPDRVLLGFR
jgi:DNA invertase Pin-like site-specific DNA recombinase